MDKNQQYLNELDIHGFTIIKDVLAANEIIKIRSVLYELENQVSSILTNQKTLIASNDGAGKIAGEELLRNLPTRSPSFFPLIDHPKILPIIEKLLGANIILASMNARILSPSTEAQRYHSDVPAKLRNLRSPIMLNVAWLIDDFTSNNGATQFIPGTHIHTHSSCPNGFKPQIEAVCIAKAGSVIIFNGQCWHRAGANLSCKSRAAIFCHYRTAFWMRFQWDPHYGFPTEWLDKLTVRQKELLRMENGLNSMTAADTYDPLSR